jgi:O-antigen/teichoic acid export membrane protein
MLVFGPDLFGFVFGEQWRTAGEYAQILSVLLVFRFVVSPLSYVLLVYGRQRVALVWQVVLVIVTATGLGVGAHLGGAKGAIAFFAGAYCLMYAVNLMLTYRLASGHLLPGAGRAPWIPQENPVE